MTEPTTIQLKVLIYEALQTQRDFTKFLRMVGDRYGRLLNDEEAHEGRVLMQRASDTIDRLSEVMDRAVISLPDDKRPPDKLPMYPQGGDSVF